eukprot:5108-Heterococcus_DN1.PRE.1
MHRLSAGCVPAENRGMLTHSASPTAKKRALSHSILSSVTALLRSAALSLALMHSQRERWAATEAAPASVQGTAAAAVTAAAAAVGTVAAGAAIAAAATVAAAAAPDMSTEFFSAGLLLLLLLLFGRHHTAFRSISQRNALLHNPGTMLNISTNVCSHIAAGSLSAGRWVYATCILKAS